MQYVRVSPDQRAHRVDTVHVNWVRTLCGIAMSPSQIVTATLVTTTCEQCDGVDDYMRRLESGWESGIFRGDPCEACGADWDTSDSPTNGLLTHAGTCWLVKAEEVLSRETP
jgi:hypothetical protein